MKKTIFIFLLLTGIANAEINYNFKNNDHKEDKNCIALFSLIRDGLADMGDNDGLRKITDLQNRLILKYAYSKQLNTHAEIYKTIWLQKVDQGYDFNNDVRRCIAKAERA